MSYSTLHVDYFPLTTKGIPYYMYTSIFANKSTQDECNVQTGLKKDFVTSCASYDDDTIDKIMIDDKGVENNISHGCVHDPHPKPEQI